MSFFLVDGVLASIIIDPAIAINQTSVHLPSTALVTETVNGHSFSAVLTFTHNHELPSNTVILGSDWIDAKRAHTICKHLFLISGSNCCIHSANLICRIAD